MAAGNMINPQAHATAIPGAGSVFAAPQIPSTSIPGVGSVSAVPPTFLEKWGVVFVSVGGVWMLLVAASLLGFYLQHLSLAVPQPAGMAPTDYKQLLDLHKTATDQFRDSVNFIFDLLVTKTILPLVTLLLGYLFGSKKT